MTSCGFRAKPVAHTHEFLLEAIMSRIQLLLNSCCLFLFYMRSCCSDFLFRRLSRLYNCSLICCCLPSSISPKFGISVYLSMFSINFLQRLGSFFQRPPLYSSEPTDDRLGRCGWVSRIFIDNGEWTVSIT